MLVAGRCGRLSLRLCRKSHYGRIGSAGIKSARVASAGVASAGDAGAGIESAGIGSASIGSAGIGSGISSGGGVVGNKLGKGALYDFMCRPRIGRLNLSAMAGHTSFVALAASYMETDVLSLREYALGGVAASILYQYFRPEPLWIPITWNTLFLLINVVMVGALLRERDQASLLDGDHVAVYEGVFRRIGMDAVDFWRLLQLAREVEIEAGSALTEENARQHTLYLMTEGEVEVLVNGERVATIGPHHFVAEVSFAKHLSRDCEQQAAPPPPDEALDAAVAAATATALAEAEEAGAMADSRDRDRDQERHHGSGDGGGGGSVSSVSRPASPTATTVPAAPMPQPAISRPSGTQTTLPGTLNPAVVADALVNRASTLFHRMTRKVQRVTGSSNSSGNDSGHCSVTGDGNTGTPVPRLCSCVAGATTAAVGAKAAKALAWDFDELREFLEEFPQASHAMQAAISHDLALRLGGRPPSPKAQYRQVLWGSLTDDVVTEGERRQLARLRVELGIDDETHFQALREQGWSKEEFRRGFKHSIERKVYQQLLERHLAGGTVSERSRKELREFRRARGLEPVEHIRILRSVGWTLDEFEAGVRDEPRPAPQLP